MTSMHSSPIALMTAPTTYPSLSALERAAMVDDSMRVTEQLGSLGTSAPDPLRAAEDPGTPSFPPVVLFLPGLSTLPDNTSARLADVMCADLTRGSGTYAVRSLDAMKERSLPLPGGCWKLQ